MVYISPYHNTLATVALRVDFQGFTKAGFQ